MVREAIQVVKNLDYHVSPQSLLLLGHPLVSDTLTWEILVLSNGLKFFLVSLMITSSLSFIISFGDVLLYH